MAYLTYGPHEIESFSIDLARWSDSPAISQQTLLEIKSGESTGIRFSLWLSPKDLRALAGMFLRAEEELASNEKAQIQHTRVLETEFAQAA